MGCVLVCADLQICFEPSDVVYKMEQRRRGGPLSGKLEQRWGGRAQSRSNYADAAFAHLLSEESTGGSTLRQ